MANTTYTISKTADGIAGTELFETRVFKGATKLNFIFNFTASTHDVVKLKFSIDGELPRLFQGTSIPTQIEHVIQPSPYTYLKQTYAVVNIVYNNFESFDYLMPIKIAQPSYFSDFENMQVVAAQFIDTTATGDMFLTLRANNNLHHISLLANESPLTSTFALSASVLAAVSAGTDILPPIASEDGNLIEVSI
jgi:hypothetical protein